MTPRRRQLLWICVALLITLCLDQSTKFALIRTLPEGSVWPKGSPHRLFWFAHERNTGLVGGLFSDIPLVAYVAPLMACGVLVYLFRHLNMASRVQSAAYGMIAGGAAGNLLDRIRLGSVTDFLQFHFYFVPFDFPWKRWPAFNIADSSICVGVFLLIVGWHKMESGNVARNR